MTTVLNQKKIRFLCKISEFRGSKILLKLVIFCISKSRDGIAKSEENPFFVTKIGNYEVL